MAYTFGFIKKYCCDLRGNTISDKINGVTYNKVIFKENPKVFMLCICIYSTVNIGIVI